MLKFAPSYHLVKPAAKVHPAHFLSRSIYVVNKYQGRYKNFYFLALLIHLPAFNRIQHA